MTAAEDKSDKNKAADESGRPLWFTRHFVIIWFTATGLGIAAAIWAKTAPINPDGSPRQLQDIFVTGLLLALLLVFAFAGAWYTWKALLSERTEIRRVGLENYLVTALTLLFLVLPLSVSASFGHGSTPIILAIVLPVLVNLLVAHRAVRAVQEAPQIQEPVAHYILTGAVLGLFLFAFLGLSVFHRLPLQFSEAWTAVILAASLLLLPEALYVHLFVAAAKRSAVSTPIGRPARGQGPDLQRTSRSFTVDLRIVTTRRRFGLIQEQFITGSISEKSQQTP